MKYVSGTLQHVTDEQLKMLLQEIKLYEEEKRKEIEWCFDQVGGEIQRRHGFQLLEAMDDIVTNFAQHA